MSQGSPSDVGADSTAEKDLAHALELGRSCAITLPAAGVVSQDMARIYRVKDERRR